MNNLLTKTKLIRAFIIVFLSSDTVHTLSDSYLETLAAVSSVAVITLSVAFTLHNLSGLYFLSKTGLKLLSVMGNITGHLGLMG